MKKNIIVTGGAGYIGSHTIIELIASGFNPIIIDDFSNSKPEVIDRIEKLSNQKITLYNLDCKNKNKLRNKHIWKNIKGVIHFAAYKSVSESFLNSDKYFLNNIGSTKNLLEIMDEFNIHNLVFSSSCTVYGNPTTLPVTEKMTTQVSASPYGETKKICEELINSSKLKNYTILRYFNPIGAHPSSIIGEFPITSPNNLVPLITECAIGKRKQIVIYGNDYPTQDGTCIRDYIHVCDVAKAHVHSLKQMMKSTNVKQTLNIGLSKGVSVLELIHLFETSNKLKIKYKFGKRRKGDIEKIYADCSLSKKALNWEPEKSIKEALIDAWNWERKNKL